jgi:hypothetical protein
MIILQIKAGMIYDIESVMIKLPEMYAGMCLEKQGVARLGIMGAAGTICEISIAW